MTFCSSTDVRLAKASAHDLGCVFCRQSGMLYDKATVSLGPLAFIESVGDELSKINNVPLDIPPFPMEQI